MPINVKFFPANKNDKTLVKLGSLKTDFINSIPQNLKDSIKYTSAVARRLGDVGMPADGNGLLITLQNPPYNVLVGTAAFLDPLPALAAATLPEQGFEVLHWLQTKLQRRWLIELDTFAASRIKKILTMEQRPGDETLFIFALPEFYFTYLYDFGLSATTHATITDNYSKPFYAQNLDVLFNGWDLAGNPRDLSLRVQGENQNVIILGGTVRWKQINAANHNNEVIYNTLPIFSIKCNDPPPHTGPSLWTKINTSGIDGYVGKKIPAAALGADPGIAAAPANVLMQPVFEYTHNTTARVVRIGVDICLDYIAPATGYLQDQIDNHGLAAVDIQALIAAGMPVDPEIQPRLPAGHDLEYHLPHAGATAFIRCDGGGTAGARAHWPTRRRRHGIKGTAAFTQTAGAGGGWHLVDHSKAKTSLIGHSNWFKKYEFTLP